MAQLRHPTTSALLLDGTPEELALVAKHSTDTILFDGVGPEFNPQEVLKVRQDRLDGLQATLDDPSTPDELRAQTEAALQAASEQENAAASQAGQLAI